MQGYRAIHDAATARMFEMILYVHVFVSGAPLGALLENIQRWDIKRWWEERVEEDWLDGLRTHARKEERHKTETLRKTHMAKRGQNRNGDLMKKHLW